MTITFLPTHLQYLRWLRKGYWVLIIKAISPPYSCLTKVHFRLGGNLTRTFFRFLIGLFDTLYPLLWSLDLVSLDTLVFVYIFPPFGVMIGFSPTSYCPYWAHFDHVFTHALKILQKICAKIANFIKQSKFRKRSI